MVALHQNGDLPTSIFFKFLLFIYYCWPHISLPPPNYSGNIVSVCLTLDVNKVKPVIALTYATHIVPFKHTLHGVDEWAEKMHHLQVFNALQGSGTLLLKICRSIHAVHPLRHHEDLFFSNLFLNL